MLVWRVKLQRGKIGSKKVKQMVVEEMEKIILRSLDSWLRYQLTGSKPIDYTLLCEMKLNNISHNNFKKFSATVSFFGYIKFQRILWKAIGFWPLNKTKITAVEIIFIAKIKASSGLLMR